MSLLGPCPQVHFCSSGQRLAAFSFKYLFVLRASLILCALAPNTNKVRSTCLQ